MANRWDNGFGKNQGSGASAEQIATINTQLDDKRSKTTKITMTDLGQDVKSAMTGGSVAIVGENSVDTVNVKNNAITVDKTEFITRTANIYDRRKETIGKKCEGFYNISTISSLVNDSNYIVSQIYKIENSNYIYSLNTPYCQVRFFDSNGIDKGGLSPTPVGNYFTFTIPNDMTYFRISLLTSDTSFTMLVVGTNMPIGYVKYGGYLNDIVSPVNNYWNINLPDTLYFTAGEQAELFTQGIIDTNVLDGMYYIDCWKNKVALAEGRQILDFSSITSSQTIYHKMFLYDSSSQLVMDKSISFIINQIPSNPSSIKNILCLGDSLTDAGVWSSEFARRLTTSGTNPTCYSLSNYNFIGTQLENGYRNEGHSGLSWEDYTYNPLSTTYGRPEVTTNVFWNSSTSKLDFKKYMTDNGFSGNIDYLVVLLGWNDYLALNRSVSTIGTTCKLFLDALHTDYPNCKVLLCGIEASIEKSYKKFCFDLNTEYETICKNSLYSSWVKFVNIASQFDVRYGMQTDTRKVNLRSTELETYVKDLIHPNTLGYNMIADNILRNFINIVQ